MRSASFTLLLLTTALAPACASLDTAWLDTRIEVDASPADTPAVTDAPVETDAPVVTDAPTVTDSPAVTDGPAIVDASDDGANVDVPALDVIDVTVIDAPRDTAVEVAVDVPRDTPADVRDAGRCGDGVCGSGETCASCTADCGTCDPCPTATNCAACTAMSTCGWCASSGSCLRGQSTGASNGSCSGTAWAWQTNQCPAAPCARFTDCRTCASQSACGWCGSSGRCATGTAMGPSTGTCGRWQPYPMSCGG